MKCPFCDFENAQNVKFCVECGKPMTAGISENLSAEDEFASIPSSDSTQPKTEKGKKKGKGCGCGCGSILAVIIALLVVIMLIPDSWLDSGDKAGGENATQSSEGNAAQDESVDRLAEAKQSASIMIDTIDLMLDNYSSFIPEKKRNSLKNGKKELKALCKEGDPEKIEKYIDKLMVRYDSVYDTYVSNEIDSSERAQISIYAEDSVKRFLNHPSSAKFGWAWDVKRVGKWYGYSGTVTASNSFGVEDEYRVYVEFKEENKKLVPKYVNIGGKVFYGSEARLKGY